MAENTIKITAEDIKNATTYTELGIKEVLARNIASLLMEPVEINVDGNSALPPMYRENRKLRQQYQMGILATMLHREYTLEKVKIKTDDGTEERQLAWCMSADDYNVVRSRHWEEINIIVGQDLFHNDDFRGRTSSGRPIEQVDMVEAWGMARRFYANLIGCALHQADKVKITYSKGNHDESMAWAFVQMLKAMFPEAEVDDSLKQRKCIFWRDCFIGVTHGAYKKSSLQDMRGQFTIQFPVEFAAAKVREIHAGHLHHEEERDIYGVMCRRLARKGMEDDWTDDEGLVGSTKRFMVFRWKPGRLAGIDYV